MRFNQKYKISQLLQSIVLATCAIPAIAFAERTETYSYYDNGLLKETNGSRTDVDDVTGYTYDAQGNRSSMVNALEQVTQYTNYDGAGRLQRSVDANGLVSTFSYHPRGWLLSRQVGEGESAITTTFNYDNVGNLVRASLPTGGYFSYVYDAANRLIEISDSESNKITYSYNAMGNRTEENIYDASNTLRYNLSQAYDQLNRLTQRVDANNNVETYRYDANGNQIEIQDALIRPTNSEYDALDRLVKQTDPLQGEMHYGYDKRDNLTSVSDPNGNTTEYSYNAFDEKIEQTSPDTGATSYQYDNAGNLIQQVDAKNSITQYQYDALNRLLAINYPDSSLNVSYQYDLGENGVGHLSTASAQAGSNEYSYDQRGNLTTKTFSFADKSLSINYQHDSLNNLSSVTYPSGQIANYERDSLGKVIAINLISQGVSTSLLNNITYLPNGPASGLQYANGLQYSTDFTAKYQISEQHYGTAIDRYYDYDAVGNLINIYADAPASDAPTLETDTIEWVNAEVENIDAEVPLDTVAVETTLVTQNDQAYEYDGLDRLTRDEGHYGHREYRYDANGNRTSRLKSDNKTDTAGDTQLVDKTFDYTYETGTNKLIEFTKTKDQIKAFPRSLDAVGSLTHQKSKEYRYDDARRLSAFYKDGILKRQYRYNERGERVISEKHQDGSVKNTQVYSYNEQGQLLAQTRYNASGIKKLDKSFIWLDATPVAQLIRRYKNDGSIKSEETHYLHTDHLNTPRWATDKDQQVVWLWSSDAFGQGAPDLDPDGDGNKTYIPLRFPGQIASAGGIYYNYFRDYEPSTGRYIQSDPIGLDGGLNTFGYVGGNPLNFTDPNGLCGTGLCVATVACLSNPVCRSTAVGTVRSVTRVIGNMCAENESDNDNDNVCEDLWNDLNRLDRIIYNLLVLGETVTKYNVLKFIEEYWTLYNEYIELCPNGRPVPNKWIEVS